MNRTIALAAVGLMLASGGEANAQAPEAGLYDPVPEVEEMPAEVAAAVMARSLNDFAEVLKRRERGKRQAHAGSCVVLYATPSVTLGATAPATALEVEVQTDETHPEFPEDRRVMITRSGDEFFMPHRGNRQLLMTQAGIVSIFIEPGSGTVIQVRESFGQFSYIETTAGASQQAIFRAALEETVPVPTLIAYWGHARDFNPFCEPRWPR